MDKQEYFLLIPAIIYGVAIIDVLQIFDTKKAYYEMVGWGLGILIAVVNDWARLFERLEEIATDRFFFLLLLAQSCLVVQIARVISPGENNPDTKAYFISIHRKFFVLLIASIVFSSLISIFYYNENDPIWYRITGVMVFVPCVFINRAWIRNFALVLMLGFTLVLFLQG